jgi:hypothetical protein
MLVLDDKCYQPTVPSFVVTIDRKQCDEEGDMQKV